MTPRADATAPQHAPAPAAGAAGTTASAAGKSAAVSGTGEIASLNGIRALAVALVFFSHGGMERLVPGGLGVTVFFVLSGYLITTLLRREYRANAAIAMPAFYLRRILRLMPPLFVIVALAALLSSLGVIDGAFSLRGLLSVLFYFGNYHIAATDFGGIPAGIGVVWSLAVEEHYYLLYPPLALLLLRSRRPWLPVLVLSVLCIAILAWRCWLAMQGASEAYISMATDTRADAILVGCLLAFWRNPALEAPPATAGNGLRDALVIAVCLATLVATLLYRDEFFRLSLRYSLQSLAIAPLIYLAVVRAGQAPFRWLNSRPMVYIGTISYTIYLSHQMILYGVERHAPQLHWLATLALAAMLTLVVAESMRRWVEQPFAGLRKRLHSQRQPKARALGPSALPAQ